MALTQGAAGLVDAQGRLIYVTSSLLGLPLDTPADERTIFAALEAEDVEFAHQQFQKCLDQPGIPVHVQIRKTHKDGSPRILDAVLLNRLDDPAIQAVVLQYRDITSVRAIEHQHTADQKRAAMLSQITELLAESFDSSDVLQKLARSTVELFADYCIVYRVQEDGRVIRAAAEHADPNEASTLDQVVGHAVEGQFATTLKSIIETGVPELDEDVAPTVYQHIAPGPVQEAFRKLGAKSSIVAPLIARGRAMGALAVVLTSGGRHYTQDDLMFVQELARRASIAIDNERLYRESQEANRLRDQFLATISHELRTPLTAIAGWAAVLRKMEVSPETFRKALESIERNVKLQTSLIDDLLDGSRIVTGKMRLNLEAADLVAILKTVVDNMQVSAEMKAIDLVGDFRLSHAVANCDPDRVEQIFWNLLTNAIKFTPMNGRITVSIEAKDADAAEVIVTDTGVGIADDFLPHVFEQFRQYDGSSTRRTAGLGLGLSIVKHLVELHGGTVRAESPGMGCGATFSVVLPTSVGRAGTVTGDR